MHIYIYLLACQLNLFQWPQHIVLLSAKYNGDCGTITMLKLSIDWNDRVPQIKPPTPDFKASHHLYKSQHKRHYYCYFYLYLKNLIRMYVSMLSFLSSGVRGSQWDLSNGSPRPSCVCGVGCKLGHEPAHLHDLPHTHWYVCLCCCFLIFVICYHFFKCMFGPFVVELFFSQNLPINVGKKWKADSILYLQLLSRTGKDSWMYARFVITTRKLFLALLCLWPEKMSY